MNSGKKVTSFFWVSLLILLSASGSFAWSGRHGGSFHGYGGFHGYYGWGYGNLYVGSIVGYLPEGYNVVVVDGNGYYYYNGYYLTACPSGYVVVPAPVVAQAPVAYSAGHTAVQQPTDQAKQSVTAQPMSSSNDTVIINIPNSTGGFTAVQLTKYKDGYKGTQGEFYPKNPTVAQLRLLYGK